MPDLSFETLRNLCIILPPAVLAITVHEAAHGFAAYVFGDKTAFILGRMTLNPLKHIDPIGTVLLPFLIFISSGSRYLFGWAKPVPVNKSALNNPQRDMALVAFAGPLSNFIMALLWAFLLVGLSPQSSSSANIWSYMVSKSWAAAHPLQSALIMMSISGIMINIILGSLNLLPIPPLDGSHILDLFLTKRQAYFYNMITPYGLWIIFGLLATGLLTSILKPIISATSTFILNLVHTIM